MCFEEFGELGLSWREGWRRFWDDKWVAVRAFVQVVEG